MLKYLLRFLNITFVLTTQPLIITVTGLCTFSILPSSINISRARSHTSFTSLSLNNSQRRNYTSTPPIQHHSIYITTHTTLYTHSFHNNKISQQPTTTNYYYTILSIHSSFQSILTTSPHFIHIPVIPSNLYNPLPLIYNTYIIHDTTQRHHHHPCHRRARERTLFPTSTSPSTHFTHLTLISRIQQFYNSNNSSKRNNTFPSPHNNSFTWADSSITTHYPYRGHLACQK